MPSPDDGPVPAASLSPFAEAMRLLFPGERAVDVERDPVKRAALYRTATEIAAKRCPPKTDRRGPQYLHDRAAPVRRRRAS